MSRDAVRESRNEELVLDILLDLILRPLASSGSEYRDSAYSEIYGRASTAAPLVTSRLATLGPAEVERRFMTILDLLTKTLQVANEDYATLTVNQQNARGVPRHFHALFVAVAQLVYDENLTVKSYEELSSALQGIWNEDLSIPSGGTWGAGCKRNLINALKGYLTPTFKPTVDQHQMALQEQAFRHSFWAGVGCMPAQGPGHADLDILRGGQARRVLRDHPADLLGRDPLWAEVWAKIRSASDGGRVVPLAGVGDRAGVVTR